MFQVVRITAATIHIISPDFLETISDDAERPVSMAHLEKLAGDDRTCLLVVLVEGKIEAYALAYCFPSLTENINHAYLYDIDVSPAYRRQGIGRLLIKNMIDHMKNSQVSELWLGTAIDNTAGQALFGSTGAQRSESAFHDFTYYLPI